MELTWLPPQREDWSERLRELPSLPRDLIGMRLRELATSRLDIAQIARLDRTLARLLSAETSTLPGLERVRVALLGSSTVSHLAPGLRAAGLRRGLQIDVYEAPYGMYRRSLFDSSPELADFAPEAVLLSFDARHAVALARAGAGAAIEETQACWEKTRARFDCQVIQQTLLPVFPPLLGSNETRLEHSPATLVADINTQLRACAYRGEVDLLAVDALAAQYGLCELFDAGLWHFAKQEVHPRAAALWGEHAARVIGAARGCSAKCLVLDLDNTLWGGVIGDDGLSGIVLGNGSARGEAFLDFQRYCKALAARGVVLAVCSKNDEANAREPFETHPEMLLRVDDIACFVANWTDKATNLRAIARRLNLGLDALVFADDNPVERALIRRELPEVHVPELPGDPAEFAQTLADAGYFEALCTTSEDRERGAQYRANAERDGLRAAATDMAGYLRSLSMVLTVAPVDARSLTRVTQLINKTNQFNVLTRRRSEAEVAALMRSRGAITLQARLADRFGDNGIISVVTAQVRGTRATIEDWLMSCRVLGRRVEEACLQVLVGQCRQRGVESIVAEYRPTAKNGLVRDLYRSLGFMPLDAHADGTTRWELDVRLYAALELPIAIHAADAVPA